MKLDSEFIKLPIRFDAARLAADLAMFRESDWKPHPQGFAGNSALSLVSVHGDAMSDAVKGPMRPTPLLDRVPYLRQVLAAIRCPIGRTRLMRIEGEGEANAHVDTNFYWFDRVRVHIPLLTYPEVEFQCGERSVNMAAGECWLFDTWRNHNVLNHVPHPRVHLVADTVGSDEFWDLVDRGERPGRPETRPTAEPRIVPYQPGVEPTLVFESFNGPVVICPWEVQLRIGQFLREAEEVERPDPVLLPQIRALLIRFQRRWRGLWATHADRPSGWPEYHQALQKLNADLKPFAESPRLPNGVLLAEAIRQAITRMGHNPELAANHSVASPAEGKPVHVPAVAGAAPPAAPGGAGHTRFDRPVFIVAAPRSGSTFLFETLARSPSFHTVGGESHEVFERIPSLNPAHRGYDSNRLTAADADAATSKQLRMNFLARMRDRDGTALPESGRFRMLEKTPKNALRIPFLRAIFPDAMFIYLAREPRENLSSIIEAWKSGKFVTYRQLPGWTGPPWSLLLIPTWRDLIGRDIPTIAAEQWRVTHETIMADLADLPANRWTMVTYSDFVKDPQGESRRLCAFAGAEWDQVVAHKELPLSRHTLTPPSPDKWRANEAVIVPVLPGIQSTIDRVDLLVRQKLVPTPDVSVRRSSPAYAEVKADMEPAPKDPATAAATDPTTAPVTSSHTNTFPKLLNRLGISLLVTTYQAGKLFIVRADGEKLNLHFRSFPMPMGLALDRKRLVLGTKVQVWEFRNQPEVTRKLEPAGKHDGCFVPRSNHYTGDIRIHELAIANRELWIVNTRFSCLCTLDVEHSFVPRWRPPFVTALAAEDRCHLNGLAVVDGRPKYVTCLGETDREAGWRDNKKSGGILMDVPTGKVLLRGLSMPHSPRWYRDQLWILESGEGSLARVDLKRNKWDTVATMPGFTRGIDFYGDYAFVGLSQVRESAVFSGIPITERLEERTCGVCVVDLRDGKTVAFLRFESGVREIFAVQVLAGLRFPDVIHEDEGILSSSFMIPRESLTELALPKKT